MPAMYGTVVWFNPKTGWGFARIKGTEVEALVHQKQKCRVVWTGPKPDDLDLQPDVPSAPKENDEVMLDTRQNPEGKVKAIAWAFRQEWDAARPIPPAVSKPPEIPKADPPLAFGEMIEALDWRFLHALLDAMEKKELTVAQLQDFVRNTPKGKRGEALWDAFHKRKTNSRDKKYGIASFIRQVLEEAGFLVEA